MNTHFLRAAGFWGLGMFDAAVLRFAEVPVLGKLAFAGLLLVSVTFFIREAVRA